MHVGSFGDPNVRSWRLQFLPPVGCRKSLVGETDIPFRIYGVYEARSGWDVASVLVLLRVLQALEMGCSPKHGDVSKAGAKLHLNRLDNEGTKAVTFAPSVRLRNWSRFSA